MPVLVFIAAATAPQFFRAGIRFVKEGAVFDASEWSERTAARIMDDRNLHVREPTKEEAQAFQAAQGGAVDDDDLLDAMLRAIPELPFGAFKTNGHPKLDAVRKAIPDADPKAITEERVAAAMETLLNSGFTVPVAPT